MWGRPGEPAIDSDVLKALAHSGNYVSGAYADRRLVGGLVGWFGGMPPHELHLHSHILGVVAGSEAHGVGFELKQHQRRWCLERGIKVVEWTTDPLVRRNGYFNLTKLGARARQYVVNVYGVMTDEINAGEESDRLLITWQLEAGPGHEPDLDELRRDGAVAVLSVGMPASRWRLSRPFPRARPSMSGAGRHRRAETQESVARARMAHGAAACIQRRDCCRL